jgi:putative transcriptional regulator
MEGLANMRKAIGYTQKDMAQLFGISIQAYYRKEKGYTPFSDSEKVIFKELVKPMFPNVTIDSIFFTENTKKCKEA